MQRRSVLRMAGLVASTAAIGPANASPPQHRAPVARLTTRDGVGLHYTDWGDGAPIVFVHSWALAGPMWDYQVAAFIAAGRRCVVYDRRGHGRSDVPGWGYDYDTLADDLASVIETLRLDQITLVGHSMGGGEIVRYLSRHGSARVERIALLSPTLPGVARSAANPTGLAPQIFEKVRTVWRQDFPRWTDENTDPFFTPQTSPALKRWVAEMMLRTPLQVALETNRTLVETDFTAELQKLKTPTLILHGDHDISAPLPLTGQRTAALVPGAQLDVVAGGPHGLFVTHVEEVNRRVLAFLGRTP